MQWSPFEVLDVTDRAAISQVIERNNLDTIFHLAAVLSAAGEQDPQGAWDVNVNGWHNILEAARAVHYRS